MFMRRIRCCLVSSLAAAVLLAVPVAQGAEQIVDVVATGYGTTVREATKAALRSAVEQVVGTMVDATTLVENDELIEDEILTYSAGMIATSKAIGEPKKSADGIYTVKIKASVKKSQLQEKLRATSAVNVALDGADLFARMTAAKDNLADAETMIKAVLAKHKDCVIAEAVPGKNGKSPIDLDPKTGEIFANIRVRIDQARYTQFANEIVEKIGSMATRKLELRSNEFSRQYKGDGIFDYHFRYTDFPFLVMTSLRTGSAIAYQFDKNIRNTILSCLDTGSLAVAVTLKDTHGSEMAKSFRKMRTYSRGFATLWLTLFACDNDFGCVMPFCYAELNVVNGWTVQCVDKEKKAQSIGTFCISLGTFSPDELKSIGKLEIKVGHMKGDQFSE